MLIDLPFESDSRARIAGFATPVRGSRIRSVIVGVAAFALLLAGLSDVATPQDREDSANAEAAGKPGQYFVTGIVSDQVTGEPIEDAEIQILVASETDLAKRALKGKTDKAGRYRIAVPIGSVQIWFPSLKPGYWLDPQQNMAKIVTSQAEPIAKHDISARPAPVWQVEISGTVPTEDLRIVSVMELVDDELRKKAVNREPWSSQERINQWNGPLGKDGRGAFTQIGESGKLVIGAVNGLFELLIDKGFDNTHVVSSMPSAEGDATVLIDANGKRATVGLPNVRVSSGVPTLIFGSKDNSGDLHLRFSGRVIDREGVAVGGAEVRSVLQSIGGGVGVWEQDVVKTRADGSFQLEVTYPGGGPVKPADTRLAVCVSHKGFATTDSKLIQTDDFTKVVDVGTVQLDAGYSIPIQVRDSRNQPVAGATLNVQTTRTNRFMSARTNTDGRVLLANMPRGIIRVSATLGNESATRKLVVSDDDTKNDEVTIKLTPPVKPKDAKERTPVAVGKPAPPWQIQGWTDGRPRSLSDFRGKVLLIDFWGVWCGPCVNSIPALKELQKKYQSRNVAFVGIHTAGGDEKQINKLKKLEDWSMPCGIDHGTSIVDSSTHRRYGIRGAPTWVIVDPDGKIAHRSDMHEGGKEEFIKEAELLAKQNGITWPPPKDASREEIIELSNRLIVAQLSREIDRILDTTAK